MLALDDAEVLVEENEVAAKRQVLRRSETWTERVRKDCLKPEGIGTQPHYEANPFCLVYTIWDFL